MIFPLEETVGEDTPCRVTRNQLSAVMFAYVAWVITHFWRELPLEQGIFWNWWEVRKSRALSASAVAAGLMAQ